MSGFCPRPFVEAVCLRSVNVTMCLVKLCKSLWLASIGTLNFSLWIAYVAADLLDLQRKKETRTSPLKTGFRFRFPCCSNKQQEQISKVTDCPKTSWARCQRWWPVKFWWLTETVMPLTPRSPWANTFLAILNQLLLEKPQENEIFMI